MGNGLAPPAPECNWCEWPAVYHVHHGMKGALKFKTCPKHLALGVDLGSYRGSALVQIISSK